jgi:hypothetical protein
MNEMHSDIDQISRDATNHLSMPFDENAWEKMEALLDKDDRDPVLPIFLNDIPVTNAKGKQRRWHWLLLLLMTSGAIGFGLLNNKGNKNKATTANQQVAMDNDSEPIQTNEASATTANIADQQQTTTVRIGDDSLINNKEQKLIGDASKTSNEAMDDQLSKALPNRSVDEQKQEILTSNPDAAKNRKAASTQPSENSLKDVMVTGKRKRGAFNNIVSNDETEPEPKQQILARRKNSSKEKTVVGKENETQETNYQAQVRDGKNRSDDEVDYEAIVSNNSQMQWSIKELQKIDPISLTTKSDLSPLVDSVKTQHSFATAAMSQQKKAAQKLDSVKKGSSFLSKIGFTVFATPELNTVKFAQTEFNFNYGLGLSYHFGKQFTAQLLLAKANKNYITDRSGYSPPTSSPFFGADTLKVDARCKVTEIQLGLRYSFKGNNQNGFFVSAGLSSYIMDEEKYDFAYYQQGIFMKRQATVQNENQHLFSNLNLSLGYQHYLGRKWMLSVEPYIKLPIAGVGRGKVNLTSLGTSFSLTFKPW